MHASNFPAIKLDPSIVAAAEEHLLTHRQSIWKKIDRLLAGLLGCEWIGCIVLAVWRSPWTWNGAVRNVNPHLWEAFILGFAIVSLPVALVLISPGHVITRHTVAAGQMLMSALLIHLGDGRIEMHFHIFGSLAFIAFYRDWRVLITASLVVALDHLIRGFYLPESIYGVMSASFGRTMEHVGWVLFEDLFLIGSCVQGVREMRGIAVNRALLEHSYQHVEQEVALRTAELKDTQAEFVKAARTAGMAEIAISVLHNVGNVLNSVNVSATLVAEKLRQSEVASLTKVSNMLLDHQNDLPGYLTIDERGKLIPEFITELAVCLGEEQSAMLSEIASLNRGVDHIKQIVAAQQSMAKSSQVNTRVCPASLFETALTMQDPAASGTVQIDRQFETLPDAMLDQHKVLQILINLIGNAGQAVQKCPAGQRQITVGLQSLPVDNDSVAGASVGDAFGDGTQRLQFRVTDNGIGIPVENLTRIFSHGFTTKKDGHGFGLHAAANSAREMSGSLTASSEGPGKGASFTLVIPVKFVDQGAACKN